MAGKTTLNAKNLEALGAQRLSELLIEISTGSAAHKRRLRMELAGSHSSAEVARQVRKRLASIARARTHINWRKVKSVKADLETQRTTIANSVAADDPKEAFDLIWHFLALGTSIFERTDDSSGTLLQIFHQAITDAGVIAQSANLNTSTLVDIILAALRSNDHGQYDGLITAMMPALGGEGVDLLKMLLELEYQRAEGKRPQADRASIVRSGEIAAACREQDPAMRLALLEIADAQGDVDAYVALHSDRAQKAASVAAEIAGRLLTAGRAPEALQALDKVETGPRLGVPVEWQLARLQVLEALNRADEAQALRWSWFEQSLSDIHLRAFIRVLPDFDDIEAEEKAFSYAHAFHDVHQALQFFLRWPSFADAAKLVAKRRAELNGDLYELLTPAAAALTEKHALAATLVLRSMIDFSLDHVRTSRYKHAARHLAECTSLAPHVADFAPARSHVAYVEGLRRHHGKKHGFWRHFS